MNEGISFKSTDSRGVRNGKIVLLIVAAFLCILAGYFFLNRLEKKKSIAENATVSTSIEKQVVEEVGETDTKDAEVLPATATDFRKDSYVKKEIGQVPFQVQAPGGKWSDPLFQNGCEEASIIMAARWADGLGELDANSMAKEIKRVSEVEEKIFGHSIDTSVEDTCKTIKQALGAKNARVEKMNTVENILEQLKEGNLVVVNAFGRALRNPNFTSPGPITHMLVVIGYDSQKKQIITNDPGTRNGRGYKYDEDIFWRALWNYPTGKEHPSVPAKTGGPVNAIVVERNN